MADKTWDVEEPKDLPYDFVYSPNTGRVLILGGVGLVGWGISWVFQNRESFFRFLEEGLKTKHTIADRVQWQSEEILRRKQDVQNSDSGG